MHLSSSGKHIGIVAMTAEGAAECYRRISRLGAKIDGTEQRPHITLHHAPVNNFMELLNAGDWNGISDMIRHSARILRAAGADFCIMPDNTAHHALPMAEVESPLPFLNMVDIVAQTALEDGHSTVGVIGTSYVTKSSTYQATLGLRGLHIKTPTAEESEELDRIILSEALYGNATEESANRVIGVMESLMDRGCDAIIVAFSEASGMLDLASLGHAVYDPVSLLVNAAVDRAIASVEAA